VLPLRPEDSLALNQVYSVANARHPSHTPFSALYSHFSFVLRLPAYALPALFPGVPSRTRQTRIFPSQVPSILVLKYVADGVCRDLGGICGLDSMVAQFKPIRLGRVPFGRRILLLTSVTSGWTNIVGRCLRISSCFSAGRGME